MCPPLASVCFAIIIQFQRNNHVRQFTIKTQINAIPENRIEGPMRVLTEDDSSSGWLIGMLSAFLVLFVLLLGVCLLKRQRGGKDDVYDRSMINGRRDYPEDNAFHEYSQP